LGLVNLKPFGRELNLDRKEIPIAPLARSVRAGAGRVEDRKNIVGVMNPPPRAYACPLLPLSLFRQTQPSIASQSLKTSFGSPPANRLWHFVSSYQVVPFGHSLRQGFRNRFRPLRRLGGAALRIGRGGRRGFQ
jgi:hypothetical protein